MTLNRPKRESGDKAQAAECAALFRPLAAISNILARARGPLLAAAATIRATVTASPVACSDETSARVGGKCRLNRIILRGDEKGITVKVRQMPARTIGDMSAQWRKQCEDERLSRLSPRFRWLP